MPHSTYLPVDHWIPGLWAAFAIFWLIAAFFTKRTIQRQSGWRRILQLILSVAGYFLVFKPDFPYEPLNLTLIPRSFSTALIGLILVVAGLFFAVWARIFLGGNWSSDVTLKQDHVLVRSGPYRFVRHPIYSGLAFALVGTTVAFGQLRCVLGTLLALIAWKLKSSVEENLMVQQFGHQYVQYRHEVKALIPYLW